MITCLNGARSAAGQVAKRREKGVLPISLPHCVRSLDGRRGRRRGKGNTIGTTVKAGNNFAVHCF